MIPSIDIQNLTKTYVRTWNRKRVDAVTDVSLSIMPGEAFGFIGPNGAGKSTTIKMLMGLARPTAGTILIHGQSAQVPEARRGLGYVPESPYLHDYLTPVEILAMNLRLHGFGANEVSSLTVQWLDRLGLTVVGNTPIRSFSKGMTQRVAIAQALCIHPRLLVMDEPLSGLDPVGRQEVVEILAEYKNAGGTLFFTSHVLHDVERLADRFGLIHQGRLRSVGSPAHLVGHDDRVLVRSRGELPVTGMVLEAAGRWCASIASSEVWSVLRALDSAGHQLIEVRPSLSLETAFMQAIGREAVSKVMTPHRNADNEFNK